MLPGVAPPGRGAPGRGPPAPGPGRGPCGRGIGRSTGCALENGLLPTRGGLGMPGLGAAGPGRGPGVGPASDGAGAEAVGAEAVGAADTSDTAGATGATGGAGGAGGGAAGAGAAGLGPGTGEGAATDPPSATGAGAGAPFPAALAGDALGAAAGLPPPKASRRRRATGASTVDDADLTNSPCSLRRARTSLLLTPSSFANSCTRALPGAATESPTQEATAVVGPRLGFSYNAWSSSELHGVLMFFATCSSWAVAVERYSPTAVVSGEPVMRNARAKARRRIAASRHRSSGCNHAPRPGRLPAVSTVTAK